MTEMIIPKNSNIAPENNNNIAVGNPSASDLAQLGDSNPSSSTILR